ncbi:MAG: heme ABC exporter ATP-binding protein CcmA, partial [Gammaproteobacteria bacterium]|nr:heme ABC exporter ATP-binding protein CcmA [Gammaproteobacteria bacterium]
MPLTDATPATTDKPQSRSISGLAVTGLTCIRDDRVLFKGLDFSLSPGQALQIEGPNGSGKTTILRILCGLTLPTDGEVCWNGLPIEENRTEYMAAMDFIGHAHGIKSELTPLENLQVAMAMSNTRPSQPLESALEQVGLRGFEDVPAITLSAGQCRRVAL